MAPVIKLISSDSKEFEVEIADLAHSKMLDTMIKDLGLAEEENPMPIPLSNVDGATLKRVLKWCRKYKDHTFPELSDEDKKKYVVPEWDKKFLTFEDRDDLFRIVMAANFLDIPGLMNVACETAASMLRGKETEQIRKEFGVENDIPDNE